MNGQDNNASASMAQNHVTEYWFEASEEYWSPMLKVIHPEGYRLNRRLTVYFLLAAFAGMPFVLLAASLGAAPLVIGIVYVALMLSAMAAVAVWYVKTAGSRTRVLPRSSSVTKPVSQTQLPQ